jgi:hypothetical protein
MNGRNCRLFFFVVALVLAADSPALAGPAVRQSGTLVHSVPAGVVLPDNWGLGPFLSGGGRTRIVQICVVVLCIALYIMMRKFNG